MQKLELTWAGKDEPIRVEPRLLIESPRLSNATNDEDNQNMLIHGDNLIALKALESKYAGKIKCIYIDPPYNTGEALENYDDNLEHSIWLGLMRQRLVFLHKLLSEDGSIWIQIDDEEQAYLKVLCDEIFGRGNFINVISVNMKNAAGASGGGEDKRLKKNCEFILVYAKDYEKLEPFKEAYDYRELYESIVELKNQGKTWHYTSVLVNRGEKVYVGSTEDSKGNEIKIFRRPGATVRSVRQVMKEEGIEEKQVYYKYRYSIFEAKDAQSSIRGRVLSAKQEFGIDDDLISIEYVPQTGKNKGKLYEQFYKGDNCRLLAWLSDISEEKDGIAYKKERRGTFWDFTSSVNNLTKEGNVVFPKGKKPEALVGKIVAMTTQSGDFVLDSFLGSGTTAAVAHKMGRRYIGIEMGDHAFTHCKKRLDKVIAGEDGGGITKSCQWEGGGGYRFYELAPSLIQEDPFGEPVINKEYSAETLAAAVALHEGFTYHPDSTLFWKQSRGSEKSFLFVTTRFVTVPFVAGIRATMKEDEFLIIACRSHERGLEKAYSNITIKKIPQMLLSRCEFGKTDYNLNIVNPPVCEDEEEDCDE